MTYALGILANLLIAAAVAGYIRHSLRARQAVGLWWDFLRDDEPIRFWAYLGLVGLIVLDQLYEAVLKIGAAFQ